LAARFPEGQAGGHRSLAGGQVRFNGLVEQDAVEPEDAIAAMTVVLRDLLGGEGDE
jgi:hypothetical protein